MMGARILILWGILAIAFPLMSLSFDICLVNVKGIYSIHLKTGL